MVVLLRYLEEVMLMTAYEILMVIITVALLIVEIVKLVKSENKK